MDSSTLAQIGSVMVRVVDDFVVIEHDIHDRPLWQALVRAGVPREKIVLAYVGETLTASPTPT
ncbi:MAG: element excision factor XisI family protein [Chloroflexota bacterium]|nr:element excision factor XisI family protein [Chloroflexota bacterium]